MTEIEVLDKINVTGNSIHATMTGLSLYMAKGEKCWTNCNAKEQDVLDTKRPPKEITNKNVYHRKSLVVNSNR